MTAELVGALGVVLAAFVKGAVGFGFPAIATPILALATDVRTAVVVLLVPNLVMDGIQTVRRPGLAAAARRHALLLAAGVLGTVAGTQFLVRVSPRGLLVTLGVATLGTVVLGLARPAWRLPGRLERPVGVAIGLAAGVLGGLANVMSPPLVPYFQAIGLPKGEFVRAMAITFLAFKTTQLLAVWQVGLVARDLAAWSAGATVLALAGFRGGLAVQDRVAPATFNRAVLLLLGVLSLLMLARGLGG